MSSVTIADIQARYISTNIEEPPPTRRKTRRESDEELERKWLHVDVLDQAIGSCGFWHKWIICNIMFANLCSSFHRTNSRILAPPLKQRCEYKYENCSKCTRNVYDTSIFSHTFWSEWQLNCNDELKYRVLFQFTHTFGYMTGTVFFAVLSDRYGRKWPLICAMTAQFILSLWSAMAPWIIFFFGCRFLLSASAAGLNVPSFVLLFEIAGIHQRVLLLIFWLLPYAGVHILNSALVHIRDWRFILLAVGLFSLVPLTLYAIYLPESPRWLMTRQRPDEAIKILTRAAKMNKRPTENIHASVMKYMEIKFRGSLGNWFVAEAWNKPNLRKYWIVTSWIWVAIGFSIASLQLESYILDRENLVLNLLIEGCACLCGNIAAAISMIHLDRRRSVCIPSFLLAFFSFVLALNFLNQKALTYRVILKICSFAKIMLWSTGQIYQGELFPTVVRSLVLGIAMVIMGTARLVAIAVSTSHGSHSLFMVVAFLSFVSGWITFLLPDTKDFKLSDTVDEAEYFMDRQKIDRVKILIEQQTGPGFSDIRNKEVRRSIELTAYQRQQLRKKKLKSADYAKFNFVTHDERVSKYREEVRRNERRKSFKPTKKIPELD